MTAPHALVAGRSPVADRARFSVRFPARCGVLLVVSMLAVACDRDSGSPTGLASANALAASDYIAPSGGDVAGVSALVTEWDAAWNAGNASGLGAQFVDDAEFINGRGQLAIGVATIVANHAASLAGPFKGSTTKGTIRKITFLSGNSAVVDVDNQLTGFAYLPPGTVPTSPGMQRGRHKRVVVKRGGHWRTITMQLTTVAPPAP